MSIQNNELPQNPSIESETVRPFRRFCTTIMTIGTLPSSYQEAMSYQEMLLWLCDFIENKVIPAFDNNANAITELQNLYIELKSYVDNYFTDLDVQEEINNKLDDMATDGSLGEVMQKYIQPYIDELNQNYENFTNETNSSLSNMNSRINTILNGSPMGFYTTLQNLISANPRSGIYLIQENGHIYAWTKNGSEAIDLGVYNGLNIYQGSITELGYTTFEACKNDGYYNFAGSDLPSITDKPSNLTGGGILIVFSKSSASAYYVFQYIRDSSGNEWYRYGSNPFVQIINGDISKYLFYNGNIISLGYNTFEACKNNGYYNFSSAQVNSITDKPSNLTQGGVLRVEKNASGGAIYQTICDNEGNQWFRHGNLPFVQIINMSSNPEPEPTQHVANWVALGDSITEGYYSYLDKQGQPQLGFNRNYSWTNYVKNLAPFNLTNKAVGGTGFVHGEGNNAIDTIKNIDFKQFNLCTISYGINDWKYNEQLGTFDDNLETGGTFYSNMRKTIEYILNDNPNIKIIVITPLNCKYGDYETNWGLGYSFPNNGTLQDIFDAMIKICEYYGIEYIDMTHYSTINRQNIQNILLDGVHPSELGYKLLGYELYKKINF